MTLEGHVPTVGRLLYWAKQEGGWGNRALPTHPVSSGPGSNPGFVTDLLCGPGQAIFLLCASKSNSDILEFYKNIASRGVIEARGRQEEGRWGTASKGLAEPEHQVPHPEST